MTNSSVYSGSVPDGLIASISPICQPFTDSTFIVFYPELANSVNLENLVEGIKPYKLINP